MDYVVTVVSFVLLCCRQYCGRKVHRLRKALKFPQGTRTRYQGKPLKIENMNDARHLEIPLFITERAWSYGMQLKQESGLAHPRKKLHMLRRYKKAAHSAAQLVKLCNAVKCDARQVQTCPDQQAHTQ